jgi:peptide deformylase
MSLLHILRYPDPMLKRKCDLVKGPDFTADLRKFVEDMEETMHAAPGCGLAAPQVGRPIRLFIIGQVEDRLDPTTVFINPRITSASGKQRGKEGCLSMPGLIEQVSRAQNIHVAAQDRDGNPFEVDASGFMARAILHEFDHLNGVLMIDHLSPMVKKMALKQIT